MPQKSDEKITFLSFKKVRIFKVLLILLGALLVAALVFYGVRAIQNKSDSSIFPFLYFLFFLRLTYALYVGIKTVEFDQSFLYITEKDIDIIVPLANIKSIEIRNLAGIYEIKLFDKIQSGSELFFKPSLIYPLDYNKQDEKVNKLRAYVWKAKQNPGIASRNELTS